MRLIFTVLPDPSGLVRAAWVRRGVEGVIQPVVDPGQGQALRADLAVRVGAFVRGELQDGLGTGQVVNQLDGTSRSGSIISGFALYAPRQELSRAKNCRSRDPAGGLGC
jgi:hypothetical protein